MKILTGVLVFLGGLIVGSAALCIAYVMYITPVSVVTTQTPPVQTTTPVATSDYAGWNTLTPGGVITMQIPPNCKGDPGAGTTYIICPTADNDQPTPEMVVSSDGITVNIRRWENLAWPEWNKVIQSIKIIAPLDRDIVLNIAH